MTKPLNLKWYLNPIITEPWAWAPVFNDEEVAKIIELGSNGVDSTELKAGHLEAGRTDLNIRSCEIAWLKSDSTNNEWLFQKLTTVVNEVNNKFFQFDLTEIESLQFTIYNDHSSDFYIKHVDAAYKQVGARKLSFTVQLSDPDSYDGGDLLLHYQHDPVYGKREKGCINFFPSYTLHEVTPVTKGTRYSLVGWVLGPKFK
jgi:PKHD-type hydroxylase